MPKSKRKEYKKNYRDAILELIKLLISRGASINAPDSLGVTPFNIYCPLVDLFIAKLDNCFEVYIVI